MGEGAVDFTGAISQIQSELEGYIDDLVPAIIAVVLAGLVIFGIPWAVRKIKAALSRSSN